MILLENKSKKPVLLIAWKRPEHLKEVIKSLRFYQPSKVYFACDGASEDIEEKIKVEKTRSIIDNEVDWPCKIYKLIRDRNKGCKIAVSEAISWFFSENNEGIILEDDCVPNPFFYNYCEELLNRYRNNKNIISISGNNFQEGNFIGDGSYYLSKYTHIWGWASWSDRWSLYDINIKNWPDFKKTKEYKELFNSSRERNYWRKIFDNLFFNEKPNTWDYQWLFTSFFYNMNTILPNTPLVENIGYDNDSTHIFSDRELKKQISNRNKLKLVKKLKEPKSFERSLVADKYSFENHYSKNLYRRIIDKLLN